MLWTGTKYGAKKELGGCDQGYGSDSPSDDRWSHSVRSGAVKAMDAYIVHFILLIREEVPVD